MIAKTKSKPLADKYGISGYPTIKFFPKGGDRSATAYSGGRKIGDFVSFLNQKCGTKRSEEGGFEEGYGLNSKLDALVETFMKEADKREELIKEAEAIVKDDDTLYVH